MDKSNHACEPIQVSEGGEFDVVLKPYRSLGPRGFFLLMSAVILISFVAGMVFVAAGAWPVTGFFGLDAALIYVAFKASYASARGHERIALTKGKLLFSRTDARGRAQQWSFEPYWVRLNLETGPAGDNRLMLVSHGRTVAIANCLGARERAAFAAALRQALAASRA